MNTRTDTRLITPAAAPLLRTPPQGAHGNAGPFHTEHDAIEVIGLLNWRADEYRLRNELVLREACAAADVELGAFDERILMWLARESPQAVAVFVGIILRAAAATA